MPQIQIPVRTRLNPCKYPSGWLGRFVLWNMNARHSKVTDWGLSHISVAPSEQILDVGCGGGRTIAKLAALAPKGKVYGIDHSPEAVAFAGKTNRASIAEGRVDIRQASVSDLPFAADSFDLVTAVETHFWWPDIPAGLREILRVLKPGGRLLLVAEIYRGAPTKAAQLAEQHLPKSGMALLTPSQHRELLTAAGYTAAETFEEPSKAWLSALARR